MKLTQAIDISKFKRICLVGGGGKTSFIFTLAREAAGLGKSVLITTTTAMFNPEKLDQKTSGSQDHDRLFIGPAVELAALAPEPGRIWMAGQGLTAQGKKLKGYTPQDLAPILSGNQFDLVLIEADGARMRPLKAPADHEPVIPKLTDMVAGCIGLDCLDRPLDDPHVHRPEILAPLTGQAQGSPVTPETLTRLAASDQGLFKSAGPKMQKALVLNKADTPFLEGKAETLIKQIIAKKYADLCLVTCFLDSRNPVRHHLFRPPALKG